MPSVAANVPPCISRHTEECAEKGRWMMGVQTYPSTVCRKAESVKVRMACTHKYMVSVQKTASFPWDLGRMKGIQELPQCLLLLYTGPVQGTHRRRMFAETPHSRLARHRTLIIPKEIISHLLVRFQSQLTKIYLLQM